MKVNYIITSESVVVNFNGSTHITNRDSELGKKLFSAIKKDELQKLPGLLSGEEDAPPPKNIEYKIINNHLYINNVIVPDQLGYNIRLFHDAEIPNDRLLRFAENLLENPSYRCVNNLFEFIQDNNLPLTEEGTFIAYSDVVDNETVLRNQVDENIETICAGLRVSGKPGFFEVEVHPKDVVAISEHELKVCCCKRLECGSTRTHTHVSVTSDDFSDDQNIEDLRHKFDYIKDEEPDFYSKEYYDNVVNYDAEHECPCAGCTCMSFKEDEPKPESTDDTAEEPAEESAEELGPTCSPEEKAKRINRAKEIIAEMLKNAPAEIPSEPLEQIPTLKELLPQEAECSGKGCCLNCSDCASLEATQTKSDPNLYFLKPLDFEPIATLEDYCNHDLFQKELEIIRAVYQLSLNKCKNVEQLDKATIDIVGENGTIQSVLDKAVKLPTQFNLLLQKNANKLKQEVGKYYAKRLGILVRKEFEFERYV